MNAPGDLRAARPPETYRVFTLGYQGRALEEVVEEIAARDIELVVDVRERAVSRRSGFSDVELAEALARLGVEYVHLPELGCERASRHELWRGGAAEPFLERYRAQLDARPGAFADLVSRVRKKRTLLLCLERDPFRCHRGVLAERLRDGGIPTHHLGTE